MAHEDFKTIYNARFSSGGAMQNQIVPGYVDNAMFLISVIKEDNQAIYALREVLETIYIVFAKGFQDTKKVDDQFKEVDFLIEDWKKNHPAEIPRELIEKIKLLSREIFWQWNSSGAGIIFQAYDANRKTKLRDAVVGKTS